MSRSSEQYYIRYWIGYICDFVSNVHKNSFGHYKIVHLQAFNVKFQ